MQIISLPELTCYSYTLDTTNEKPECFLFLVVKFADDSEQVVISNDMVTLKYISTLKVDFSKPRGKVFYTQPINKMASCLIARSPAPLQTQT